MLAGGDTKFTAIPEDSPLEYKLKFADESEVQLTEHIRILAGGIKDLLLTPFEKDAAIPVPQRDITGESFELLIKILHAVKSKEPTLYLRYLNQEEVKEEVNKDYLSLFKDIPDDVIIRAANATAFFSFTLPRRIICWYLGYLVNQYDVMEIRRLFNATPLDKETCLSYGLDQDDPIWEQYPDIKSSVFGV